MDRRNVSEDEVIQEIFAFFCSKIPLKSCPKCCHMSIDRQEIKIASDYVSLSSLYDLSGIALLI